MGARELLSKPVDEMKPRGGTGAAKALQVRRVRRATARLRIGVGGVGVGAVPPWKNQRTDQMPALNQILWGLLKSLL